MRSYVLAVALGLLAIACGSHVESGTTDPLLALERDPEAALAAAKHPTYKATYEMTMSSVAPSPTASPSFSMSSKQIYAARPPDFSYDFSVTGLMQLHAVAVIRGQSAYICIDTAAPAACYNLPPEYAQQTLVSLNVSPLDQMRNATKDMDVTVLPRERIAGREGACFQWRAKAVPASPRATPDPLTSYLKDAKLEACFTAEGVMLRTLVSAGNLFSVDQRATTITDTVTDADFALPYPITSAPLPFPTSAPLTPSTPRPTPTH